MRTSSKIKKRISLLLVMAMILTAFPMLDAGVAYAAGNAAISSDTGLTAEAGGTVTVPINIANNPGFAGLGLVVTYDQDILTPVSVEATSMTADGTYNDSIETSKDNSFKIIWASSDNLTGSGTLFNISFNVSEYAQGDTTIQLSYLQDDTYNENFEDVAVDCSSVTVNVTPKAATVSTLKSNANQSVNANEEIAIPILIDNVDKVSSLSFDMSYDAAVFGMPVLANGIGNCTVSGDAGTLSFSVNGIDTSVSSGTLMTLTFKAAEFTSGNYVFDLTSDSVAVEDFRIKVVNTHAGENAVVYGKNAVQDGTDLSVDVGIKNNHGLAAFRFTMTYDASLITPVSATKNSALAGSFDTTIGDKEGSFDVLWFSSDNFTDNDTLYTVKFNVKDSTAKTTVIGMAYSQNDTCDEEMNDVVLTVENIDITLNEEPVVLESISAQKTKTDYKVGETVNTDDITVTAAYSDGSTKTVTGFTTNAASLDMSTTGSKTLTVTYTEDGKTATAEIIINVAENDQQAASNVETVINDMDASDEASVQAARAAYDALTDEQKALVDPAVLKKLTDAEEAIAQQEEDQQAASNAENVINGMDASDEASVQAARAAYDALTDEQKALVDPAVLKKLTDAEEAIAQQEEDQQAASNAENVINGMDASDEASVQAARAAYDALTDEQKALVDPAVLKKLEDAEAGFVSDKIDLSSLNFKELGSVSWNGTERCPCSNSVYYNTGTEDAAYLTENEDYTVQYVDNDKVGTATAILTGIGKYKGTKELHFEITPVNMKSYAASVKLSSASYTYSGKVITPAITLVAGDDQFEAPFPTKADYTLSCSTNRKSVGSHKVTFTFRGNYTGTLTYTFKINPKGTTLSKLKKGKKSFTAKWKKQSSKMPTSRITGYQIRYSLKSNMTKSKTVTVKGYKKVSKTIKKLKAKKKYYVQIRTYMKVGGKTYYSSWSKKKTVKTK